MIDLDYDERTKLRMIAAIAILVGSILGIISGGILLQGNPDDLLNSSLFNEAETVDLTGQVLTDDGVAINNATIQLYEDNSNSAELFEDALLWDEKPTKTDLDALTEMTDREGKRLVGSKARKLMDSGNFLFVQAAVSFSAPSVVRFLFIKRIPCEVLGGDRNSFNQHALLS